MQEWRIVETRDVEGGRTFKPELIYTNGDGSGRQIIRGDTMCAGSLSDMRELLMKIQTALDKPVLRWRPASLSDS